MLKDYSQKRHFDVTTEPPPVVEDTGDKPLTFVIQKHAASHLHYDFRLELNGVLVSWAVPKGPSLNPQDKRLAAKVEDHPFAYGGFEGNIPQGEYGGGQVIIWDKGTYEAQKIKGSREIQEKKLTAELASGKLEFILHGEKLKGAWVLVHTRDKQWLLMKRTDEYASERDVLSEDQSVVSGTRIGGVPDTPHQVIAPKSDFRKFEPMLLTEAEKPFSSPDWSFELKLDGVRLIVYLDRDSVQLFTRNSNDVTDRFPELVPQLKALNLSETVLDGEAVMFDESGRPNFQALIQPFQAGRVKGADLCIFDVLCLEGKNVTQSPFSERRKLVEGLPLQGPNLKRLDVFPTDGNLLFEAATQMGFEGIVGKRLTSTYQSGIRSKDWLKVKGYHSEEFVITGFTRGDNARASTFGALLLGKPTPEGLRYVGNVGGGFNDAQLTDLRKQLDAVIAKQTSLLDKPPLKNVTWVEPKLVAEVRFTMWTKDNRLRFPIFQRMRPDVTPTNLSTDAQVMDVNTPAPDPVLQILSELEGSGDTLELMVEGEKIRFSSLQKELWPGVTKRDLARYYASVSGSLLKYLKDRPLSFVRCPEGVNGERFFQKHLDRGRPKFMEVVSIHSDSNEGSRDFVMCSNLASLMWVAQMAVLELNPWNSHIAPEPGSTPADLDFATSRESLEGSLLNRPDYLVFDLDPHFGGKATGWKRPEWERLVETAYSIREILSQIGLKAFPKSSGKSGLHLYMPVARIYTYDQIRAAAGTIGQQVEQRLGKKVTLEWNTKTRPDGVFIDVNQNVRGKTMAATYSPRAAASPGVSMPLLWDELDRVDPTKFTVLTALDRLREKGDLWAETVGLEQRLF